MWQVIWRLRKYRMCQEREQTAFCKIPQTLTGQIYRTLDRKMRRRVEVREGRKSVGGCCSTRWAASYVADMLCSWLLKITFAVKLCLLLWLHLWISGPSDYVYWVDSSLGGVSLIKPVSKSVCPSVCMYVRTYVHLFELDGMPCGTIQGQGQGHVALKVRNSSIFKIYLVCRFQWELANDYWFFNQRTISKFVHSRFLTSVLVFVSHSFELGSTWLAGEVDRHSHTGLIFLLLNLVGGFWL